MEKQIALITGGTSGIGFETAKQLAQRGVVPIIIGRREEVGQHAEARLKEIEPLSEFVQCDMQDHKAITALPAQIVQKHGSLAITP